MGLIFALAGAVACGSSDDSGKKTSTPASQPAGGASATPAPAGSGSAGTYTLTGFADHTAPGNFAPPDVTASGGTLKSCNPARLYAFLNFSNVTPPKQF